MTDLYQSQRAMRNMRRAALQRGVVAVLDVGTSKIACLVLKFENAAEGADDGLGALAGQSQFRVIGAATTRSRGVRFGEVDAMAETERAIRTAVQAAQKMAQTRVDHVIACFAGAHPRSYGLAGEIELSDGQVSEQDVARVLAACEVPDYGPGREALHAHPVNFAIDHRSGLGDPRGHLQRQRGHGVGLQVPGRFFEMHDAHVARARLGGGGNILGAGQPAHLDLECHAVTFRWPSNHARRKGRGSVGA